RQAALLAWAEHGRVEAAPQPGGMEIETSATFVVGLLYVLARLLRRGLRRSLARHAEGEKGDCRSDETSHGRCSTLVRHPTFQLEPDQPALRDRSSREKDREGRLVADVHAEEEGRPHRIVRGEGPARAVDREGRFVADPPRRLTARDGRDLHRRDEAR